MKKLTAYTASLLAALLILVLPAIPHHHHNGEACFVHEHCDADDEDNDCHTAHHGDNSPCRENYVLADRLTVAPDISQKVYFTSDFVAFSSSSADPFLSASLTVYTPCSVEDSRDGHSPAPPLRAPPVC